MIRGDVVLVFPFARINQEVIAAVGVLYFREKIRLFFRFFLNIAFAVAAFGQAQVVQFHHARENVGGENQLMDE